jgi:hypothetical protein
MMSMGRGQPGWSGCRLVSYSAVRADWMLRESGMDLRVEREKRSGRPGGKDMPECSGLAARGEGQSMVQRGLKGPGGDVRWWCE